MMHLVLQFHGTIHFLMHKQGPSKWHGMVMCVLNNGLLLNVLYQIGISNKHSQAAKICIQS
jgi:hypothetical protein